MSRDEIIQLYPIWNEQRHDIVKVMYGEDPLIIWNEEYYKRWCTYTGTASNIEGVNAYMWSQNGDYFVYSTLIGEIYITTSGRVLGGTVNLKYRGLTYNIHLNLMYGFKALDILRLSGGKSVGFSSKDGTGSPASKNYTEELDKEHIEKVLNVDLSDYGESIHSFIRECITIYEEDNTNYILEKTFNK